MVWRENAIRLLRTSIAPASISAWGNNLGLRTVASPVTYQLLVYAASNWYLSCRLLWKCYISYLGLQIKKLQRYCAILCINCYHFRPLSDWSNLMIYWFAILVQWLPGKIRLRNDMLCVERDIKLYSLTHSVSHSYNGLGFFEFLWHRVLCITAAQYVLLFLNLDA